MQSLGGGLHLASEIRKSLSFNYVAYMGKPDAPTALSRLTIAFGHYNERHPHKALKCRSPREFRRAAATSI
jgi:putative transposase